MCDARYASQVSTTGRGRVELYGLTVNSKLNNWLDSFQWTPDGTFDADEAAADSKLRDVFREHENPNPAEIELLSKVLEKSESSITRWCKSMRPSLKVWARLRKVQSRESETRTDTSNSRAMFYRRCPSSRQNTMKLVEDPWLLLPDNSVLRTQRKRTIGQEHCKRQGHR